MRLILVDNLLVEDEQDLVALELQPHLGLISLVSVACAAGHQAIIYDPKLSLVTGRLSLGPQLYSKMAAEILALQPDVVGFTTLGCNFMCALQVASSVKMSEPELPILLGGPHATILHSKILERFSAFDVVVRHEAERTLAATLSALEDRDFRDIAGLSYRSGEAVVVNPDSSVIADLDCLPFPAYDSYPIDSLGLKSLRVEAGRGCPFACTFCSTAPFFGRQYRVKSASRLLRELNHLAERYGVTHFELSHDLFTVNKRKVREFCQAVQGRGYTWSCSARTDCVDSSLLEEMYSAGCRSIYFGIETGAARLQRQLRKGLEISAVLPTLRTCVRRGLTPTASFITSFPEETREDQADTLDMIGSCVLIGKDGLSVQLHLLTPEPGTVMLEKVGASLEFDGYVSDFNLRALEPDDEVIIRTNPDIFVTHHFYPSVQPRHRHIFVTRVFRELSLLGRDILSCVCRYVKGRLSFLMDRLFDSWERSGRPTLTAAALETLVLGGFGDGHPVSSLVRYGLALRRLERLRVEEYVADSSLQDAERRDQVIVLAPWVEVLDGVHNCPKILEASRQCAENDNKPLDIQAVGGLGSYALVRRPDRSQAEFLRVDPWVSQFLAVCREPCRVSDVARRLIAVGVRESMVLELARGLAPTFIVPYTSGVAAHLESS